MSSETKVYLDYTQAELDRAYDQRAWAANADAVIASYGTDSAKARAEFAHTANIAYGPTPDETLDLFLPLARGSRPAPVHVHVHGGGWRNLTKDEESFLVRCFAPAGAMLAVLNFATIPKVRIPEMMAQARRAIAWLHANVARLGGDPDNIHVSGHSSGGHMAGVLTTTDWAAHGLPADVVKSGLLVSGMYDLRPVMLSARSSYVTLSAGEIDELSAILHIDRVRAPLVLAWGELETPEFQRQPQAYADALEAAGKQVTRLMVPGQNHFEILRLLGDANSPLGRAALGLMGLAR